MGAAQLPAINCPLKKRNAFQILTPFFYLASNNLSPHMKSTILFVPVLLLGFVCSVTAQSLIVSPGINLPKDAVTKNQLISSLNGFLDQKDKPKKQNAFVLKAELPATSMLLDELKGMEKNAKLKDDHFYKAYLQNVISLDNDNFIVQLNYMSIADGAPVLRASFRLMAKKQDTTFYFYSPLKQYTRYWKTKKIGNINFHFKDTLNLTGARFYQKTVSFYDSKLKAPAMPIEDYYCDNFTEAQQILGLDYKLEYNGLAWDNLSVRENDTLLVVNGWNSYQHRFDTHDLWHERLRLVVSPDIINRPIDEGCAYLYGGSWEVYSWTDIITLFKKYTADNPDADWLTLYIDSKNKNFLEGQKPLKISYAINALIAQKIEKEKGFAPVLELLSCGKMEKGDANLFKAFEKVIGITKANFNAEFWKLIKK